MSDRSRFWRDQLSIRFSLRTLLVAAAGIPVVFYLMTLIAPRVALWLWRVFG